MQRETEVDEILRSLDPADIEGIEPPDEIWAGIEATLLAQRQQRPRLAPSRDAEPRLTVEYAIDAADIVVPGDGRDDADEADRVPELAVPESGRTLWSHMAEGDTRTIWVQLVDRARASGRTLDIPFRCDGPTARRWFEMQVIPDASGGVRFRSTLVFEESREPVVLLDGAAARRTDAEPVVLCAWCGHGQHGGEWLELEELVRARRLLEADPVPMIDAGVCDSCQVEMTAEVAAAADA